MVQLEFRKCARKLVLCSRVMAFMYEMKKPCFYQPIHSQQNAWPTSSIQLQPVVLGMKGAEVTLLVPFLHRDWLPVSSLSLIGVWY